MCVYLCVEGGNGSIQFGAGEADAAEILEDGDLGVNVVEDDLGAVEVEAQSAVKLGS